MLQGFTSTDSYVTQTLIDMSYMLYHTKAIHIFQRLQHS